MTLRPVLLLLALAAVAPARADEHPAYWGAPSVYGGKCCASLAQVRAHIDAINRDLVRLMAERQKYVAEASRFKRDPAAVSDPARVDAIIVAARAQAREAGLDEAVAERTFRAMIGAFEDYERAEWARRQGAAPEAK